MRTSNLVQGSLLIYVYKGEYAATAKSYAASSFFIYVHRSISGRNGVRYNIQLLSNCAW